MVEKGHPQPDSELLPIGQRIAWMIAIWAMSVGALAAVTMLLRAWLLD